MNFPFDDLNMRDQEHVDWVKSTRDPELWQLDAPFPPERELRYFVEDGAVLDYNPGPFLIKDRQNR